MFFQIFIAIIVILLYMCLKWAYRQRRIPPGPPCLPIIGCLPFLKSSASHELFNDDYFEKYGDLMSFQIGLRNIVICSNYRLVKDLFAREDLTNRIDSWYTKNIRGNKKLSLGIIHTNGKVWREQRRFALKNLRDFGFGRKSIDSLIQEECLYLISFLLDTCDGDGDVHISTTFNVPIINVLWQIIASKRFELDSNESNNMMNKLNEIFKSNFPVKRIVFPFLNNILPLTEFSLNTLQLRTIIRQTVKEIQSSYNPEYPANNFIEVYLNEIYKKENANFHVEQLVLICLDFFQAGTETSSTTLMWAVMFMALNSKAQTQCQEEIDNVIGMNILPSLENVKDLPWCHATLLEVQRLGRTAYRSLDHYASNDLTVDDNVVIPKGALVFANLSRIMMDPTFFPNPDEFNPQRFLTEDRKVKIPEQFIPFGIGKRMCMGDSLAKHELFIFFVMMLQKMTFSVPKSHSVPNVSNFTLGITRIPHNFFINIKSRSA